MRKRNLSLEAFPNSFIEPFTVTSAATGAYNCIAWALEETHLVYWPLPDNFFYWHPDLPRVESLDSFVDLFSLHGYAVCDNALKERGFTKIALFAKDGVPTHAARQLSNGLWTSKLGILEDVRHSLFAISGGLYGSVALVFKKKRT